MCKSLTVCIKLLAAMIHKKRIANLQKKTNMPIKDAILIGI